VPCTPKDHSYFVHMWDSPPASTLNSSFWRLEDGHAPFAVVVAVAECLESPPLAVSWSFFGAVAQNDLSILGGQRLDRP